jgi:Fe-S-cluster containining protein
MTYWVSHREAKAGCNARDLAFMLEHWTQVGLKLVDGTSRYAYRCDRFDEISRTCTAHSDRPPVCSDYPWYSHGPIAGHLSNPRCSYLLDLPPDQRPENAYPLIPLTIIQRTP